jgi:dipicolinate synthase subunit A
VLCSVEGDALIIDLASMPGGVDDGFAASKSIKVIHALSLPGKTAPVTAGKNIADAVIRILERRGVL